MYYYSSVPLETNVMPSPIDLCCVDLCGGGLGAFEDGVDRGMALARRRPEARVEEEAVLAEVAQQALLLRTRKHPTPHTTHDTGMRGLTTHEPVSLAPAPPPPLAPSCGVLRTWRALPAGRWGGCWRCCAGGGRAPTARSVPCDGGCRGAPPTEAGRQERTACGRAAGSSPMATTGEEGETSGGQKGPGGG